MTFYQRGYLPESEIGDWQTWGLNEIPWLACVDPEFHQPLPRLSAWFTTNPDGLAPMGDRLLTLTCQLSECFWLDLQECSPLLLRNNDHKLGWKESSAERIVLCLMGDRKVMVKDQNGDRRDYCLLPGDLLLVPPDHLLSMPRTRKVKSTAIFLIFE